MSDEAEVAAKERIFHEKGSILERPEVVSSA